MTNNTEMFQYVIYTKRDDQQNKNGDISMQSKKVYNVLNNLGLL